MPIDPFTTQNRVPRDRLIDFDITNDPGLNVDIFQRLEEVRSSAPSVAYSTRSEGWLVFGRDEIKQVMIDGATFSSSHLGRVAEQDGPGFIPLSIDPPEHAPWRHLLNKYFGPSQVKSLEPFVREWAERLISKLHGATSCDFLKAVAEPMPVSIFMILMGLPLERFDDFRGWVARGLSPSRNDGEVFDRMSAHREIKDALHEIIEQRRRNPRDDLVTRLIGEQIMGRAITKPEMMSICYLLFLAGLDTVTNAMTFGMRHLAQNQDFQAELRRDRGLIPVAVEKLLRLYTFVNTMRIAKRDVELDGIKIRAGDRIWCVLWSGSNDRDSDGARHLAFGFGHHLCLGMHLARLELRVMYESWFEHIGRFALAHDGRPGMRGGAVMTISRLLLTLEPCG